VRGFVRGGMDGVCSGHGALLACMREFMRWMSRTGFASEHMGAIIHAVLFNLGSSWSAHKANLLAASQPVDPASVNIEVSACVLLCAVQHPCVSFLIRLGPLSPPRLSCVRDVKEVHTAVGRHPSCVEKRGDFGRERSEFPQY